MKILSLMCLLWFSSSVSAAPIVIADFGGRETGIVDMQAYFEANKMTITQELVRTKPQMPSLLGRYPVWSDLEPGLVQEQRHGQTVIMPFFIVGADEWSQEWLIANVDYLAQIGARGMAANIESAEALNYLRELAPPLVIEAVPVDEIAKVFGINNYPVLVSREAIEQ